MPSRRLYSEAIEGGQENQIDLLTAQSERRSRASAKDRASRAVALANFIVATISVAHIAEPAALWNV